MPLLNRLLWAKLDSLPTILFDKVQDRLTANPFLLQATAGDLKRVSEMNMLRPVPIDFNERIRLIALKSVHNAFHHEALTFANGSGDESLQEFLQVRIEELNRIMKENLIE